MASAVVGGGRCRAGFVCALRGCCGGPASCSFGRLKNVGSARPLRGVYFRFCRRHPLVLADACTATLTLLRLRPLAGPLAAQGNSDPCNCSLTWTATDDHSAAPCIAPSQSLKAVHLPVKAASSVECAGLVASTTAQPCSFIPRSSSDGPTTVCLHRRRSRRIPA